jgi:hypothetical protein
MNLEELELELQKVGTVNKLEMVGDYLNISINNFFEPIKSTIDFMSIANRAIIPHYPTMITFVNEGGSIKSIFTL